MKRYKILTETDRCLLDLLKNKKRTFKGIMEKLTRFQREVVKRRLDIKNKKAGKFFYEIGKELNCSRAKCSQQYKEVKNILKIIGLLEAHNYTGWIEELDLSVRSYNALKRAGINTQDELIEAQKANFANIKGMGKISINEIKAVMEGVNKND
jgi:DNA-directed RNA polymerase alpha subunit